MKARSTTAQLATLLATAAALTVAAACDDGGAIQTCEGSVIPSNACEVLEDDSECTDPCCAAAYQCVGNTWSLAHACPGYSASKCSDGATTSVTNLQEAGVCDAAVALPPGANGGPGCIDLEPPDCPVGEVLTCGAASCVQSACEALWYCEDGEWWEWGTCDADGGLVPARGAPSEDAGGGG
jgi:hypothetical protein